MRSGSRASSAIARAARRYPASSSAPSSGGTAAFDTTITDDQGRFSQLVLPGDVSISTSKVPRPYVNTPATGWRTVNVPKEVRPLCRRADRADPRGAALRGVALDESGKPAAGASVRGAWQMTEEGRGGVYASGATADADGRFALEDIAPDVDVKVSAQSGDLATTEPVAARAGQKEDLTLRLVRSNTGAVRGRVVGPDGRPIAGALVTVQYWRQNSPNSHSGGFVTFKGTNEIRTTDDGTFRTPRELLRADEYAVEARSDGFIAGRTDWIRLEPGDVTATPDIALMKATTLCAVAGRVVDRRGAPIVAADVLQSGDGPSPTRARTDAQGRFQLRGVVDAAAFLFAEKSGHRFAGRMIGAGGEPVELVLDRSDERPRALRKAAAWLVPRAEERTIARKLLEPAIAATRGPDLRSCGNKRSRRWPGSIPGACWRCSRSAWSRPDRADRACSTRWPSASWRTARARPSMRSRATAIRLPASAPTWPCSRRPRLKIAISAATCSSEPSPNRGASSRPSSGRRLAQMGDSWRELGEPDRAAPILRNARALFARSDPQGLGYVQYLAPALAAVDLPAGLALAEGPDRGRVRQYPDAVKMELGEIAWRIAASHPGEAERLIGRMNSPTDYTRDAAILRACRSMATGRPGACRADRREVCASRPIPASRNARCWCSTAHAVMADALAGSNPEAARRMLDETMAGLRPIARDDSSAPDRLQAACLLASFLTIVQRIAPDRLEECLWEVIACRPSRSDELDLQQVRARGDPGGLRGAVRPVGRGGHRRAGLAAGPQAGDSAVPQYAHLGPGRRLQGPGLRRTRGGRPRSPTGSPRTG